MLPSLFQDLYGGGCSTQGRNSFIMARESVLGGGGREREREISRQFYLTESFYQSAQQRQEKDKSLTREGTGVSPHTPPFKNTHTHRCQRTRSHTQANPEDVIDKPQRCREEEGALLRDFLWMKEIFGRQLDSRQNVTAANKQSPAVMAAVLLRHLNGCQRRHLSIRQSVCSVVSELLTTGGTAGDVTATVKFQFIIRYCQGNYPHIYLHIFWMFL